MQFDFPWFALIYLIGTLLTLVLAIVIWKRQFASGALSFTALLFSMALWTATAGLEAGAVEIPLKILLAKAEYVAVVSSGALSLTFILELTHNRWITRRRHILLLWIIPVLSLGLVWTNDLHGLVWSAVYLNPSPQGDISIYEHGALYLLVPVYQYILYFTGIIFLVRYAARRPRIYRRQVIWLLAGSLIPIISSVIYISGGSPIRGFDLTPVAIAAMGVVYAFTIFHFRLLDNLPTATAAFLKNLPDGFLLLDSEEHILRLNPATRRIMGWTGEEDLTHRELCAVWPELARLSAERQSGPHLELTIQRGGQPAYLDISIDSFNDPYGALTSKLLIIRDMTELKTTQLELENEIGRRTQFTRTIIHELRNPLTAIVSSGNELEQHEQLDERIRKALVRNISRAATDLEERIDELFELARGEMGLLEINLEPLDMQLLVEEIGAEMAPVAAQKGLRLNWSSGDSMPVQGDRRRLRQVLANLLTNAIKFTSRGEIEIRIQRENHELLVQVRDSGRGIEKEALDDLFDPFRRSSGDKNPAAGLGIGLSLSKQYVELHHGRIWAESVPGRGTTISFTLPLQP